MLAPALDWCRYPCRPVRGTPPVTTACLPEIRSAAGTGGCARKYPHVHRGEGTHTSTHADTLVHTSSRSLTKIWRKTNLVGVIHCLLKLLFPLYTAPFVVIKMRIFPGKEICFDIMHLLILSLELDKSKCM